ncbi:zinc finger protein 644 isoform X2 [Hypomesus transpacificus]|uniref:zinc finger protein 644 isoform X2 n=1 Tax=Hypomesus transpacificus TaxID=137520 RepID=UPI001F073563|nr:zinc finger protein 644 isoform X2 [Hypomesus transpacificus]
MADLKPNAQEDKDVEPESDSSGPTQEPLHSHPLSLKNHASGNSLPLGARVNGPGSHPTSEESCVLNKGSILPNNVLDTARQPEEDTGLQVLPPPIVLQSDARRKTAGCLLKTLPTQPGAITQPGATPPPSDTEKSAAELLLAPPPGRGPDQTRVSQISTNKRIDAGSMWEFDTESSESSSDDPNDEDEDANWDPQKELMRFLWNGHAVNRSLEENSGSPRYVSQRRRKHNIHTPSRQHKERRYYGNDANEDTHIDANEEDDHDFKSAVAAAYKGCDKDNQDDIGSTKPKKLKKDPSEQEPPCFPFTKRSVHIKEQRHLHKHMIYHLDVRNQVRQENVPRPFICRECGRSFRDHSSLSKHMIIHQERREKLMEEIKGLSQRPDEGKGAWLQCPRCVFGSNCPNAFVQHAKTHGEGGRGRHSCKECNHDALTEQGLKAHMHKVHFKTHSNTFSSEEDSKIAMFCDDPGPALFHCKGCPFTSHNENSLKMHLRLIHKEMSDEEYENALSGKVSNYKESMCNIDEVADQSKNADLKPLQLKPKFCVKKTALWKAADLALWTSSKADFHMRNPDTEESYKGLDSSQFKHSLGSSTNKLSQSLQRSDKRSKLSLQPHEKIDVTTGLPFVEEDNQEKDHIGVTERTKYPSNMDVLLTSKTVKSDRIFCHGYNSDSRHGDCDLAGRNVEEQAVFQKSLSKRKMSTPLRNAIDRRVDDALPRLPQRSKGNAAPEGADDEDTYDFSDYTGEATAHFLDSNENEKNPYARSYFIRRQRAAVEEDAAPADDPFERTDREDDDSSNIQQLVVKEECIESAVSDDFPPSLAAPPHSEPSEMPSLLGTEQKSCPYCPATFESGVGLSNHVRGHLHRVGLSYDSRHMVSPEQVASQDCKPRIRRKIPSVSRRVKRADKPESQGEHTCPLCWGWFDTKTGLSNHVRGHLKRIGTTIPSTSKSPLCILNELLRNEKEHQNVLQLLNRKQSRSRPFVSQKFIGSDGLFLMPTGVPVKIQHGVRAGAPWGGGLPKEETEDLSDKGVESQARRGTPSSSSTLVELLKRRRNQELEARDGVRKHYTVTKENAEGTQATGLEPNWARDGPESIKKMCIHCNTIFPSAVSLSNHLRAYARRKRVAMLEGTSYDCKQKKLRPRPGLKKKVFPQSNAVEQIYRLTCRFCDLVFQGPLSVQEDWIKHLQRHLMHIGVPHTGTGMVEILGLHQEMPPSSNEEPGPEQHTLLSNEEPGPEQHTLPSNEEPGPEQHTLPSNEEPGPEQHTLPMGLPLVS